MGAERAVALEGAARVPSERWVRHDVALRPFVWGVRGAAEDHSDARSTDPAARQLDRQATARADVEKNGVTILDRFGIAKENPAVAIERQAAMAFVRIMRELNLDAEKPEESRAPRLPGGRY